jgi:hypothetical protein
VNNAFADQIRTRRSEHANPDDVLCDAEIAACKAAREKKNGHHPTPARYCDCDELLLRGRDGGCRRLPCPPGHDCEYTRQRSALVEEAAALATKRIPFVALDSANAHKWTARFVQEMERLSRPLLRQSNNGTHEQKAV